MPKLPKNVMNYFPYKRVRPYQKDFTEAVYEAVENSWHILIEGSNGLGKTVAALSACLPVAKEHDLQIIYAAKTHRQHDRVIEELKAVSRKKAVSGLSIRGRYKMCFHRFITHHASDARSAMDICELLKKRGQCRYYENLQRRPNRCAELQSHISSHAYKAMEIMEVCRAEDFCPYEMVKLSMGDVDVVALSYLYVFHPSIRAAFMKKMEKSMSKFILVVDEAHNLPNAAVEIASDKLSLFTIRQAEREAEKLGYKDISAFCEDLGKIVKRIASKVHEESVVPPDMFLQLLRRKANVDEFQTFFKHLCETGNAVRLNLLRRGEYPRSYIHRLGEFLLNWLETVDDISFTHVLSKYRSKGGALTARLEIVALDPSKITAPVFSSVHSAVVMSGTLQPLQSYTQITDLPEGTVQKALPAPFPRENILALVCRGVTTLMKKRTLTMYKKIVKRIAEVVHFTPANVGVFATSYNVLEALLEAGLGDEMSKPLLREERNMSSKRNDQLVSRFKSYANRGGAVLLGVQGGRSSEGADYPGNEMNSVVVVGVPYATPTPKVQAQIKYYEFQFPKHGREYGYVLPAMKKASQTAGRPIRTLQDQGAIVFLDYRFATGYCQRFLPSWIRQNLKTLQDKDGDITQELMTFFDTK
ncbi:MAG: helicase C-terminal domain-containing protein [Thermoproteota archaeon]|nr:helicase C-terminal domain-containing protein [Thermoproteota archaeon]